MDLDRIIERELLVVCVNGLPEMLVCESERVWKMKGYRITEYLQQRAWSTILALCCQMFFLID